jgi:hypothetical protein
MTPETTTIVIDGPHNAPGGGQMTRIVILDEHGCEIGWLSIDTAGHGYGPHSEHPDRDFLGWPEGIDQPYSFCNNVDDSWACPSYEAAVAVALSEHATRLDQEWRAQESECRFAVQ